MTSFELVPFGSRAPKGSIACDGLVEGAELDLSHWPKNATPAEYKADTSTESCLRWAAVNAKGPKLAVNNHFDVDGALSALALVHRDVAAAHETILVGAAEMGDFDVWPSDERGIWLALAVQAIGRGRDEAEAYEKVLAALPAILPKLASREDLWGNGWAALRAALERAERGMVSVERIGAIALVVHKRGVDELPGPVLDKLLPPRIMRVLLAFEEGAGTFSYRYELPRWAWADTVVRPKLRAPSKNALVQRLGSAQWALKGGGLGMTGIVRTKTPIADFPVRVAARLLEREEELRTLPASSSPSL